MLIKESALRKIVREELRKKLKEGTIQDISEHQKTIVVVSAVAGILAIQAIYRMSADYVLSMNTKTATASQAMRDYQGNNCGISIRGSNLYFEFNNGKNYVVSLKKIRNLPEQKKKEFLLAIGGPLMEKGEMSYKDFSEYMNDAGITDWLSLTNPLKVKGFEESGLRSNRAARRNLNFIIKVAHEIGLDDIGDHSYYRIAMPTKKGSKGRGGTQYNLRSPHYKPTDPKNNEFLDYFKK